METREEVINKLSGQTGFIGNIRVYSVLIPTPGGKLREWPVKQAYGLVKGRKPADDYPEEGCEFFRSLGFEVKERR